MRRLESQVVPPKQAEAITSAMTEVLNDCFGRFSTSFVSKPEMDRVNSISQFLRLIFVSFDTSAF